MDNKKYRFIIIIIISAVLVSILFNIWSFLRVYEMLSQHGPAERSDRMYLRMYFPIFNFIIEFIVFCTVALFNLFWLDKMIKLNRFKKGKGLVIIISNIIVFFILTLGVKIFHKAFFSSITEREINFDITYYSIMKP